MVDGHMYPVRVIQETAQLITGRIVCVWEEKASIGFQGVVIPIGTVVTAATGIKKRSRGQGLFLVSVTAVKMFMFCACVLHIV